MPIKPPVRPENTTERHDQGTNEVLGTSPVPKEWNAATPAREDFSQEDTRRERLAKPTQKSGR